MIKHNEHAQLNTDQTIRSGKGELFFFLCTSSILHNYHIQSGCEKCDSLAILSHCTKATILYVELSIKTGIGIKLAEAIEN